MYYLTMIVPVFNSDDCLGEAIDSVVNQTIGFENIELIIVDDCSTDNTRDVINDYEKRYPNVKGIFLDKNNGGAGIPRNIGIENATTNYLMFMDADDEYEKDACEIFYNKIIETNADFVFSNWTFVAGNKISKDSHRYLKESQELTFEHGENIKEYEKYYRGGMCAAIYNRDFVLKNDIKCHKYLGEDGYFSLKAFFNAKKIVFLEYYGYYNKLRISDEKISITNVRDEKMFKSREKSIYLFNDLLEEYGACNKKYLIRKEIEVLLYQMYMINPGVPNKKRKELFKEINRLENEFEIYELNSPVFNFLNYFVLKEHYTVAILMSRVFGYIFAYPKFRKILREINM